MVLDRPPPRCRMRRRQNTSARVAAQQPRPLHPSGPSLTPTFSDDALCVKPRDDRPRLTGRPSHRGASVPNFHSRTSRASWISLIETAVKQPSATAERPSRIMDRRAHCRASQLLTLPHVIFLGSARIRTYRRLWARCTRAASFGQESSRARSNDEPRNPARRNGACSRRTLATPLPGRGEPC